MIVPDILNPFFPGVVRGAEDVALVNGYRTVLCNTDNNPEKGLAHVKALQHLAFPSLLDETAHEWGTGAGNMLENGKLLTSRSASAYI